jgi:Xaa-Pro dipeptidase
MELGASDGHLGPITSGARIRSIHGQLGERVLAKGDVLHVELVPEYRGYSARMMRSAVLGEPSAEQRRAMQIMVEAQDAQIAAMRPGARAGDIDRILRDRIVESGLRERFDNVSGYTLGFYGTPRSPRASDFTRCFLPDADWRLEPRMLFHMYVFGGGLSLSETVLVGEHGPERLTSLERKLFVRA